MQEHDTGIKGFLIRSIILAEERGNDTQIDNMAGLTAQLANFSNHLRDQQAGIENAASNPHHDPEVLKSAISEGIFKIHGLIGEILKS